MKCAIVGSRSITCYPIVEAFLDSYFSYNNINIDLIVSGGAIGVDTLAEKYAKEKNIPTFIIKPEWDKYGKSAGFVRNRKIIESADLVIAFWDGKSKGTQNSLDIAKELHKKFVIIIF